MFSSSKDKDKGYYIAGTSFNKLGRYDMARSNFKSLLDERPKSVYAPLAQLGIADSYYLDGDYPRAYSEYEKYLTKYPKDQAVATAYFRLAKCAQKQGDWQASRNYYQKVKSDYPWSFEARMAAQALSEEMLYFTVQVGSFNKKSNALNLCDALIKKGYEASILKARTDGEDAYKVRIGRFNKRQEAEAMEKRLKAEGLPTKLLP
ncbi:MAG: tetratricopeptide repeat protein [Candidatus Omnitrophota bacterium]